MVAQWLMNLTRNHEAAGLSLILGLLSGLRIWRCPELGCRSKTWMGSGIAVALVQAGGYGSDLTHSLEPPYAVGAALKRLKKKKKERDMLKVSKTL